MILLKTEIFVKLWNCENVPIELPPYIEVMNYNPIECIGYGLDKKTAEEIRDYKKK